MTADQFLIQILGPAAFLAVIIMTIVLAYKMEQIRHLKLNVNKLKRSLDEMDEQAKLIVRTDMELNRTQEELDKKVVGLYALQRLTRSISTTLEEAKIFKKIDASYLAELGFEKACGFLWSPADKKFIMQFSQGYTLEQNESIQRTVETDKDKYVDLIRNEKTVSSISRLIDLWLKERIKKTFFSPLFIASPIIPKEGIKGFLLVGTESTDTVINEGDEELITILANQISQALDNARLYEKTWKAQQELEEKVRERTHELTGALNEVKIISKRKTDFISSVSHELRTPLTSIKGYASIILEGKLGDVPDQMRQRLEKVNKHSDELVHLVNDLLDIARIESGRFTMKPEAISLAKVCEKVMDLLGVQFKQKNIISQCEISNEAKEVFADSNQVERILINLIGNAIKFTPEKGKISVSAHSAENRMVQVNVTDSGCGIPAEAQESIFDEFYRVDNPINQEVKGTGLGLSLVKHIVEAHKGKIWFESKPGRGSTFSFTLPAPG